MSSDTAICLTTTLGSKGKHISEIKKTILRPLIQLAVKAIEQEHIEDGILDRLSEKYNLPPEKVDEWYSTVLTIFKAHLRSANSPMKTADFKECLQELKFENSCIDDLCAVLYGHKRPALIHALTEKTKFFPMLKACRWRIDVTISSSYLSRVLEPTILMEWTLSSGQRYMFELSMAKFHLLRHTIASLLLRMQELESTTVSKAIPVS
ncbi:COMM domain-containing protein 5-like isoform X1 [Diachasmimorpha longicaudata]|uniref:COMM domain-containing protein 5-like isoform X1 n=1 Tax=Diachasmimorpha longicaudata TaxID=58733 RepID=UPI0030B8E4CC